MFAIRIDWLDPQFPNHSMITAAKYTVSTLQDGSKQLMIEGDPRIDQGREILLSQGATAYVMNDRGITVDIIRTPQPPHPERGSTARP